MVFINQYNSFKKYLIGETLKKCIPGIETIEQGINIYYKYYTKEDENKYKIVAICLKLIKSIKLIKPIK